VLLCIYDEKTEKEMIMNTFEYHLNKCFEIAAEKYNCEDPFDKCKYREIIAAEKLGHDLFEGASGGKYNDDTYGADATDPKDNDGKVEYKSAKMTKTQYDKYKNGVLKKKYTMVYNGAYDKESIARYANIRHMLNLFYKAELVATVEVPTGYVLETLNKNLDYDNTRRAKGEIVTTNCNSVGVQFVDNTPTIGEVID
jgi:hypothetical protein